MKANHIIVEQADDGWLAAHATEDDSLHTQGRTLDEITANIREWRSFSTAAKTFSSNWCIEFDKVA